VLDVRRPTVFVCAQAIALCHAWAGLADAGVSIEMDFANTPGAHLSFDGHNGTFSFTPDTSGHEFQINNVSGGTGSALGLFGTISGTFTIGMIANNEAAVTGSGVLTVLDGPHNLTANISFLEIEKPNSLGVLNPDEHVNLSNVHYTGTNQDLSDFAGSLGPAGMLIFFDSHTLAHLESGGQTISTGFAGNLDPVVPEPGTMTIFLAAAPLVGGFWFKRRRRNHPKASQP
jgi:hypothetical protein